MTDIQEIIAWLKSEAQIYDEQGLTTDMEYGDRLHQTALSLERLVSEVELRQGQVLALKIGLEQLRGADVSDTVKNHIENVLAPVSLEQKL